MKEVKAYKTTSGKLFESKKQAEVEETHGDTVKHWLSCQKDFMDRYEFESNIKLLGYLSNLTFEEFEEVKQDIEILLSARKDLYLAEEDVKNSKYE
jgi:hypothetical protein